MNSFERSSLLDMGAPFVEDDASFMPLAIRTNHGVIHIDLGAKGPETTFITGGVVLDDPLATPILATLPPLIRRTPDTEQAVPSFLENIETVWRGKLSFPLAPETV
ncbi:hypothetical protein [Sorangium sp. So ce1097]|uniref:hypothetical protein n=1 Tax=Sorangium sp. So ce1097 TaxID=3133330 RepID=UPI003F61636A